MTNCARLLAAPLAIVVSSTAWAGHWPGDEDHALPCRPTIACTADFIPPGGVEVELGYLLRRLAGGVLQHSTPVLVKLTLAEWVQLQVATNGYPGLLSISDLMSGSFTSSARSARLRG
jgi:hypothetical protein